MGFLTLMVAGMLAYALTYEVVQRTTLTFYGALGLGLLVGTLCLGLLVGTLCLLGVDALFDHALPAWALG